MKKYVLLTFILVACSLLFLGLSRFVTAQEGAAAPDSVTLDCSFGKVTFSHKGHTAAAGECKTCHHMGTPDQKCVLCHSKEAKVNAQSAFHKNCIDCHKKETKGPTGCMDCHKK